MAADGTEALLAAITAALETALSSLSVTVYGYTPQDTAYPYVVVGDGSVEDWGTKDSLGTEQTVQIEVWSRYRGFKQALDIAEAIYAALHEQSLSVDEQQCVLIRFENQERTRDGDGYTQRLTLQYRALLDYQP